MGVFVHELRAILRDRGQRNVDSIDCLQQKGNKQSSRFRQRFKDYFDIVS